MNRPQLGSAGTKSSEVRTAGDHRKCGKKETKILNKILDFSHRVCGIVGPIQKGQGGVIKSVQ